MAGAAGFLRTRWSVCREHSKIPYSAAHAKILWLLAFVVCGAIPSTSAPQSVPYTRSFPKSKDDVEKALHDLQASSGQKLPIVDGFVVPGDQPLDRYERAYYQFAVDILPGTTSADTIVRVSAKITAWYTDHDPTKSGYQVLASNGRLESDLLDRLADKLGVEAARFLAQAGAAAPQTKDRSFKRLIRGSAGSQGFLSSRIRDACNPWRETMSALCPPSAESKKNACSSLTRS